MTAFGSMGVNPLLQFLMQQERQERQQSLQGGIVGAMEQLLGGNTDGVPQVVQDSVRANDLRNIEAHQKRGPTLKKIDPRVTQSLQGELRGDGRHPSQSAYSLGGGRSLADWQRLAGGPGPQQSPLVEGIGRSMAEMQARGAELHGNTYGRSKVKHLPSGRTRLEGQDMFAGIADEDEREAARDAHKRSVFANTLRIKNKSKARRLGLDPSEYDYDSENPSTLVDEIARRGLLEPQLRDRKIETLAARGKPAARSVLADRIEKEVSDSLSGGKMTVGTSLSIAHKVKRAGMLRGMPEPIAQRRAENAYMVAKDLLPEKLSAKDQAMLDADRAGKVFEMATALQQNDPTMTSEEAIGAASEMWTLALQTGGTAKMPDKDVGGTKDAEPPDMTITDAARVRQRAAKNPVFATLGLDVVAGDPSLEEIGRALVKYKGVLSRPESAKDRKAIVDYLNARSTDPDFLNTDPTKEQTDAMLIIRNLLNGKGADAFNVSQNRKNQKRRNRGDAPTSTPTNFDYSAWAVGTL